MGSEVEGGDDGREAWPTKRRDLTGAPDNWYLSPFSMLKDCQDNGI